jgi:hypothetical protein
MIHDIYNKLKLNGFCFIVKLEKKKFFDIP